MSNRKEKGKTFLRIKRKMQIIIAIQKQNLFIFLRNSFPQKKAKNKREYLHNMHPISANKTTTLGEKEENKNTLINSERCEKLKHAHQHSRSC